MSTDSEMNVVQAYKKFNGQLIILVSGLSACGKSKLAKYISDDFELKYLNQFDYYKKDYNTLVKLPDGREVVNWDSDDAIDWERFNEDVNKNKKNGVIVSGFTLPDKYLKFKPDYHLHISMSKKVCLEKRKQYIVNNKDKYPKEYELLDTQGEHLQFNRLTFPYYLGLKDRMTVNKYLSANEKNDEVLYDEAFDILIKMIDKNLEKYSAEPPTSEKAKETNFTEGSTSNQQSSKDDNPFDSSENPLKDTKLYKNAKKRQDKLDKISITLNSDEFVGSTYPYAEFY